jgi:hypothetical protein
MEPSKPIRSIATARMHFRNTRGKNIWIDPFFMYPLQNALAKFDLNQACGGKQAAYSRIKVV